MAPLEKIRSVVGQIVAQFRPRKVILFGSHARGNPDPDSDVDLLVLLDTSENPLRAAGRISAAVDHPFPLDILVMTPQRLAEYLDEGAFFFRRVLTEGVVLYEEDNDRVGRAGGRKLEGAVSRDGDG